MLLIDNQLETLTTSIANAANVITQQHSQVINVHI